MEKLYDGYQLIEHIHLDVNNNKDANWNLSNIYKSLKRKVPGLPEKRMHTLEYPIQDRNGRNIRRTILFSKGDIDFLKRIYNVRIPLECPVVENPEELPRKREGVFDRVLREEAHSMWILEGRRGSEEEKEQWVEERMEKIARHTLKLLPKEEDSESERCNTSGLQSIPMRN